MEDVEINHIVAVIGKVSFQDPDRRIKYINSVHFQKAVTMFERDFCQYELILYKPETTPSDFIMMASTVKRDL